MELRSPIKLSMLSLLVITTNALAESPPKRHIDYKDMGHVAVVERSGFEGFSAGLGLGIGTMMTNITSTTTSVGVESAYLSGVDGSIFSHFARSNVYKFGPMGNLFIGYGYMKDIYYLGVDVGLNILGANESNLNHSDSANLLITSDAGGTVTVLAYNNAFQTKTKVTRGWAEPFLDIKLGGLITPQTNAYIRGGLSLNSVTIKSDSTYQSDALVTSVFGVPPINPSASTAYCFSYTHKENMVGLRVGGGMEVLLTPSFGVASDYIYTFYPTYTNTQSGIGSDISCDAAVGCIAAPTTVSNTTKTSFSDQQVMVKFIYHLA